MATSGNTEKQCRAVLLLTRASAEMMRAVIMDSVSKTPGQSLDDFLRANFFNITHYSDGRERDIRWVKDILFPMFGGTDISKWEFNVLCFVVMDVCFTHPDIANNVEDLKAFRNKLFHAPNLSDEEYSDLAEDIETKTLRCCRTLNKVSLTSDVEKIIESIKKDPLSFQKCNDILRSWYDSDKQISDQLKELSQEQKATQEGVDYLIKRLCPRLQPSGLQFEIIISDSNSVTESDVASILVDMTHAYIQQQQQEQQQRQQQRQQQQQEQQQEQQKQQQHIRQESDATPERKDQGTESSTEESVGQEHKEQASTEKQEHARNLKSKEPNMETVKEKFEMVLHKFCIDKTVIIKCQKGSVHIFFQCTSFDNLMKKVSECIEGRTTRLFLPVQEALRQLEGYEHVCLDVVLIESWYEECIENTIKLLEERLREGLEIDDRTEDTGKASGDGNPLLTVASSSYMALLDLKNQCSSDDLRQALASLAEALKIHLKIDNLSLEIKAHKAIWQDQATDILLVTGGEAPGRLLGSTGSEHLNRRICQACLEKDNLIDAKGLCVNCQDYLCLKIKPLEYQTQQAREDTFYRQSPIQFTPNRERLERLRTPGGFGTVLSAGTRNVLSGSDEVTMLSDTDNRSVISGSDDISILLHGTVPSFSYDLPVFHTELNALASWIQTVPMFPRSDTENASSGSTFGTRDYHLQELNVKTELGNCWITGMVVLPDNRLVLTDFNHSSLKALNVQTGQVVAQLQLISMPWDITSVEKNTVVVTLPYDEKIALYTVENNYLSFDRALDVGGMCFGVDFRNGKLAVSFISPHRVQILNLQGCVLRNIAADMSGEARFSLTFYLTFGQDDTTLYVSNCNVHNVVCVDMDGTVMSTYTDRDLRCPSKAVVDSSGNVYVCTLASNTVHNITKECKKLKVMLTQADGLDMPHSICLSEEEDKLYVGMRRSDNVKVYRIDRNKSQ